MNSVFHVISASSVKDWLVAFSQTPTTVAALDISELDSMGPDDVTSRVRALVPANAKVCLHSAHQTLVRDALVVEQLTRLNVPTLGQSVECAQLGVDKVLMKQRLAAIEIATISSIDATSTINARTQFFELEGPFVLKKRYGTSGLGQRLLARPLADLEDDTYQEVFTRGVEYSVNVWREGSSVHTLPVVWKGMTRLDLIPPYRRLRLCPAPDIDTEREMRLRSLAAQIAVGLDSYGFLEVEFLVTHDGSILIVEINPRISGTLRMSAMAARANIADFGSGVEASRDFAATRCAIEVPFKGRPFATPESRIIATTRVTAAGSSYVDALQLLGPFASEIPFELSDLLSVVSDCRWDT